MVNPTSGMSPAAQRAWQTYTDALEWIREFIYSREFSDRDVVRRQANQFLMQMQAASYQWVMAPRVDYPRFYRNLYEPMVWNFGFPSPDYGYRWAFVDGSQTYRIQGKRGHYSFFDIQVQPLFGSLPDEEFVKLPTSFYSLDQMDVDADGRFEIIASPDPHDGNWIKLDPKQDRIALFVRECFSDWASARPSFLRIERLDTQQPGNLLFSEAAFVKRLEHAARFVKFIVKNWVGYAFDMSFANQERIVNRFATQNVPANSGVNSSATYHNMVFDIGAHEALIIESDVPTSQYWSFAISDRYTQVVDFMYHQSSLNGHQAHIDSDGKFRAVLSQMDPGIANWLDPVDTASLGLMQFRQFFQNKAVGIPKVTSVEITEVDRLLPKDTPRVSPEQRHQQLAKRATDLLSLYSY